jgi:parallel beta-helix repeat protein
MFREISVRLKQALRVVPFKQVPYSGRFLALCLAGLLNWPACADAADVTIHVAVNGRDDWSGSLARPNAAGTDGPVATLQKARDLLRTIPAGTEPGIRRVSIGPGHYFLPATVTFEEQDSGTEEFPVIYSGADGEFPVLMGGLPVSGFTPWKGKIQKAPIDPKRFGSAGFSQLLLNGTRQPLARYPNFDPENPYGGGWAYADGDLVPMYQNIPGESKREFQVKTEDVRNWAHPELVQVFTFPRYNWWNNIVRLSSFDPATRKITLVSDCSYAVRPGDRYYFQNALEELDSPGEWFLDAAAGVLYFWPPHPLTDKDVVTAPTTRAILAVSKARHLHFERLRFECSAGSALTISQSRNCQVRTCIVRSVGDYSGTGISVSGGEHNAVIGCDVSETGRDGIALNGGERPTLTGGGHLAENNYIHHTGVYYKQGVGISMSGVGHRAAHNLIHDGPRMGILFSGNNLVLEYNHIRHVNLETEDTGAVYTGGRDWISSRGSVVRYNYFHDILGFGRDAHGRWISPHFAWGVYLDDNTGGVDVIGNVIARCSRAGIHLHNGRDNRIFNNLFLENGQQQVEYSGWKENSRPWQTHLPTMLQGYARIQGQPAWKSMRNIQLKPEEAVLPDGTIMAGNEFERNIAAWKKPDAKLFRMRNVNLQHNTFDNNVYWHFGQPVSTGVTALGQVFPKELAPNGGFEQGTPGKLPGQWKWQVRPPQAQAQVSTDQPAQGTQCLQMNAAYDESRQRDNAPIVISQSFPLKPGHAYRLQGKFRSTLADAKAQFMVQSYVANAYFWANSPHTMTLQPHWTEQEFVFTVPAPGERGYHEQMKEFVIRIDFPERTGALFADAISLKEVELLEGFAAWQSQGADPHSAVQDPGFVDFDHDDFRLTPDSIALKLGFEPIPVERIGPYADPARASWPIQEAPGAREHPLVIPASSSTIR